MIADKSIWLWDEKKNTITDLTPGVDVPILNKAEYKNKIYIPTYGNGIESKYKYSRGKLSNY